MLNGQRRRPWTIYTIVGLAILSTIWAVIADDNRTWWDPVNIAPTDRRT